MTDNTNNDNLDNSENKEDVDTGYVLVEVVSVLNVPNVDKEKGHDPDPYVVVSMEGQNIHQTTVLFNTQFPIWSLECGSLFLVNTKFKRGQYVRFVLMEYQKIKRHPTLGTLDLSVEEMLEGNGERQEFPLVIPGKIQDVTKSVQSIIQRKTRLVLRFKPATPEDIKFIQTLQTKKAGIFSEETYLPPVESLNQQKAQKTVGLPPIEGWGVNLFSNVCEKQKPSVRDAGPDPLLVQAMRPSKEWIKVGREDAPGKIYVEIIGCNDLPNLDTAHPLNMNNLTDAFCCLVLEDSIVNTTYVSDNLSPRWMPQGDHRAFVFGVTHPSSHLYIGVFNHNTISKVFNPGNAFRDWIHTPIGRVLINLTQFHPDTLYTLHYHLYEVSNDSTKDRREENHNGTLILRLRIEWDYQIMAGMRLPPEFFVSVPKKHDFQTATYTTVGERGSGAFNMTTLSSFLWELESYVTPENAQMAIVAALTLLLWRGTHKITLFGREKNLPVHSMIAFTWGVLVTNNYNRFPSFVVFTVAWLFLISMEQHRKHPSPWRNCESYLDLCQALLAEILHLCIGDSSRAYVSRMKENIPANENIEQIESYNEALRKQKELHIEAKKKQAAELEEEVKQHEAEMAVANEDSVATMTWESLNVFRSLYVNPLKPILHPVQETLHQICVYLRVLSSIAMWDENYFPMWIVTFCLLTSAIIFFVPWGLVLRWLIRITVWVLLGPWMRIVDWYYFEQLENMTPEEQERYVQQQAQETHKALQAERLQSRTEREDRVKRKSMMKYLFGKYVVRVPRFQQAQFLDDPLPASTAVPYRKQGAEAQIIGQVCGQTLVGDMIPSRMVRTQPFERHISHERPSDRSTWRFNNSHHMHLTLPKSSASTAETEPKEGTGTKKRKRMKRFSFWKKVK